MLFDIISDIHLGYNDIKHWTDVIEKKSDYLIMAGDVTRIGPKLIEFLDKLCTESNYTRIFYVCGNHEYFSKEGYSYLDLMSYLRTNTNNYSNFTILDNEYYQLNDDIVIFGTTLWSHLPENKNIQMPIYDQNGNLITKSWYMMKHYQSLFKLENTIRKFTDKKLIVVSHYCPTFDNTQNDKHYHPENKYAYCSDLDLYLTSEYIHTWVFGHIHKYMDTYKRGLHLVANPYRSDNHQKNKQIEVK